MIPTDVNAARRDRQFVGAAASVAIDLRWRGMQPGARIGVAVDDAAFPVLFHGALLAGCVAVPIDDASGCDEIGQVLRDAEVALLYLWRAGRADARRAAEIWCVPTIEVDAGTVAALVPAVFQPLPCDEDAPAALLYRSGRAAPTLLRHRHLAHVAHRAAVTPQCLHDAAAQNVQLVHS